ncbi:MAG: RNA polymerase sigma factor [uncultured Thiotrichaceae bacterium]|uniref:RNA polymerase sigma factor n=1 Tax=uncultured Thiotrichaceae bacterium TaxID=298394 RepID=A0A6S6U7Z5_9GAMM|nr:MAG: RNA polymerase sigma factor [uncultured Thiotrichaceae bacterium]
MARIATKDEQEALDIVQEAMYKLVQKYSNKSKEEWPGYYFRILHNKINDWHRREKVRNRWRVFITPKTESDTFKIEDAVAQKVEREPEEHFIGSQFSKEVLEAIEGLPRRQQQALTLRIWEGLSVADTATIMQCSEGSVKTHLSRAVHRLRDELEDPFVDRILV